MGGGCGKTLLTLGLCRAFKHQGYTVQPFKKGPDYIDAAWLTMASDRPTVNLDPFFLDSAALARHFAASMNKAATSGPLLGIMEGNRGLYDGLDAQGSCSTANIARTLNLPILLCVNCEKTTRTLAALLKGMLNFEKGLQFCGVVLNRVGSTRHEKALLEIIPAETGLAVLGALPRLTANPLPERHMGLASKGPQAAEASAPLLDQLGEFVGSHCDLAGILAGSASIGATRPVAESRPRSPDAPQIGYVEDKALWFYYPENLEALEASGAILKKLSIFESSAEDWQGLHGLYLGGGFPEDYAGEISGAASLGVIRQLAEVGLPIYAECGGLMLLCQGLTYRGKSLPMAGIFPPWVEWKTKPHGLGYMEAEVVRQNPFFAPGSKIRGHEFHYSFCSWGSQRPECALRLARGKGVWQSNTGENYDGLIWKNVWGAYMHIFAPAVPDWANSFVRMAQNWRRHHEQGAGQESRRAPLPHP